jgi:hypothetical protein
VSQCWRCCEEPCVPVLRRDRAGGTTLLEVVAHHGGGAQRIGEVLLSQLPALVGGVLPDPGETVGLQLEADRAAIAARRVRLVGGPYATGDAEQHLDVMGDLVSHHVRARERPSLTPTSRPRASKNRVSRYTPWSAGQ